MSAGSASSEARRLARHREEMELALRDGLTLDQARYRIAEARIQRTARCGTAADRSTERAPVAPRPRSWMDRYENY